MAKVALSNRQLHSFLDFVQGHPYTVSLAHPEELTTQYVTAKLFDAEGNVVDERTWYTTGEPPRGEALPPTGPGTIPHSAR